MPRQNRLREDVDPVPTYTAFSSGPTNEGQIADAPPPPYNFIYADLQADSTAYHSFPPSSSDLSAWQKHPFYVTSIDRADDHFKTSAMYYRLPTDAQSDHRNGVPAAPFTAIQTCNCSERGECTCGNRGALLYTAEISKESLLSRVEMRVMRCSDRSDLVARVKRGHLRHRDQWAITTPDGKPWAIVERSGTDTNIKVEGQPWSLTWSRQGGTFFLRAFPDNVLIATRIPQGVLHLENPLDRMPQNLACDVSHCPFRNSLYGFAFRCVTCSELKGDDTVDFCEAHLEQVCRAHDPEHRMVRLPPRTGQAGEEDDQVRETPLLRMSDLLPERKKHELIVVSLSVALLLDS